jgi:hypothetical protein
LNSQSKLAVLAKNAVSTKTIGGLPVSTLFTFDACSSGGD